MKWVAAWRARATGGAARREAFLLLLTLALPRRGLRGRLLLHLRLSHTAWSRRVPPLPASSRAGARWRELARAGAGPTKAPSAPRQGTTRAGGAYTAALVPAGRPSTPRGELLACSARSLRCLAAFRRGTSQRGGGRPRHDLATAGSEGVRRQGRRPAEAEDSANQQRSRGRAPARRPPPCSRRGPKVVGGRDVVVLDPPRLWPQVKDGSPRRPPDLDMRFQRDVPRFAHFLRRGARGGLLAVEDLGPLVFGAGLLLLLGQVGRATPVAASTAVHPRQPPPQLPPPLLLLRGPLQRALSLQTLLLLCLGP